MRGETASICLIAAMLLLFGQQILSAKSAPVIMPDTGPDLYATIGQPTIPYEWLVGHPKFIDTPNPLYVGTLFRAIVKTTNIGEAVSAGSVTSYAVSGSAQAAQGKFNVPALASGASFESAIDITCTSAGTIKISVQTDSAGAIAESDERNNRNEISIACVSSLPDMTVVRGDGRDEIYVGDDFDGKKFFLLANIGHASSQPFTLSYTWTGGKGGTVTGTTSVPAINFDPYWIMPIDPFFPYGQGIMWVPLQVTCFKPGTQYLTLQIDPGNAMPELNEGNNAKTFAFNCVTYPPPYQLRIYTGSGIASYSQSKYVGNTGETIALHAVAQPGWAISRWNRMGGDCRIQNPLSLNTNVIMGIYNCDVELEMTPGP